VPSAGADPCAEDVAAWEAAETGAVVRRGGGAAGGAVSGKGSAAAPGKWDISKSLRWWGVRDEKDLPDSFDLKAAEERERAANRAAARRGSVGVPASSSAGGSSGWLANSHAALQAAPKSTATGGSVGSRAGRFTDSTPSAHPPAQVQRGSLPAPHLGAPRGGAHPPAAPPLTAPPGGHAPPPPHSGAPPYGAHPHAAP
jgi:hypothetical protein